MTTQNGPDPNRPYPMADHRRVCFIKNFIKSPNIIVGDYSYYDDPVDPEGFERNVLYNYDSYRLIIALRGCIRTLELERELGLRPQPGVPPLHPVLTIMTTE